MDAHHLWFSLCIFAVHIRGVSPFLLASFTPWLDKMCAAWWNQGVILLYHSGII